MSIPILVKPKRFGDERGWFSETYSTRVASALGISETFVQDNHSLSRPAGTLRGLHFQLPPHAQAKLVRCVRGRIWDVAVDVRHGSPTWGRSVGVELSAENGHQLYVPVGFAHGFLTLEPDSEVIYKVSDLYAPECDTGVRYDSADVHWPDPCSELLLSAKDKTLPPLASFESPFAYEGPPLPERLG